MILAREVDSAAYLRISSELARQIDDGELRDGDQIPTRPELERQYGVSRQVVRDALALLHHDGYLESLPRKGTFVRRLHRLWLPMRTFESSDDEIDAFVKTVHDQGRQVRQDIRVEIAEPPPEVMQALELADEELAIVRKRTRYVDDVPYSIADSYYPQKLFGRTALENPRDIPIGGRHVLATLGYELVRHSDELRVARRPDRRERDELHIAPGTAIIRHRRVSSTASNMPVRVLMSSLPADRWTLTYDIQS
jgi:GntR family transcriptional regulator